MNNSKNNQIQNDKVNLEIIEKSWSEFNNDSNDSNYETKISNAEVTTVYHSSGRDGYFQTRIKVAADTSGISTAFSAESHATLYRSNSVSALTPDGATGGVLYVQQVQTTGDA